MPSKGVLWDRAFAVACACCKADDADVPEVEAVIALLLPSLRDVFVVALLAALLAPGTPPTLDPETLGIVQRAAERLVRDAARLNGLPLAPDVAGQAALATEQLRLLVEDVVRQAVAEGLPAASRIAQDITAGLGSQATASALRGALAEALDAQQALRPMLDAWAYQTFNAGSIRAAAADGHNFIQLHAKIDGKTTAFCRLVDGRVVPMAVALGQLAAIEAATRSGNVEALRLAAPFFDRPDRATQADVDAALARGGLAPFHHGCRTRNVPVRL